MQSQFLLKIIFLEICETGLALFDQAPAFNKLVLFQTTKA